MDGDTNETGATWFEQGLNQAQPWTGLPPAGTTFTPTESSFSQYTFKMPDTYVGNCAIFNSSQVRTGSLTLGTPTKLGGLAILGSSGGGATVVDVTIRFRRWHQRNDHDHEYRLAQWCRRGVVLSEEGST